MIRSTLSCPSVLSSPVVSLQTSRRGQAELAGDPVEAVAEVARWEAALTRLAPELKNGGRMGGAPGEAVRLLRGIDTGERPGEQSGKLAGVGARRLGLTVTPNAERSGTHGVGGPNAGTRLRFAKVEQESVMTALFKQDVVGAQVAVHPAGSVQGGDGVREAGEHGHDLDEGQAPVPLQAAAEGLARHPADCEPGHG